MTSLQHIMIVEDDPDIREIASMALTKLGGFKITVCESGEQALQMLSVKLPHLILLDVMMPGIDGKNTLKSIKQHPGAKNIPIIFITAKTSPKDMETYKQLGTLDVIAKPFNVYAICGHSENLAEENRSIIKIRIISYRS